MGLHMFSFQVELQRHPRQFDVHKYIAGETLQHDHVLVAEMNSLGKSSNSIATTTAEGDLVTELPTDNPNSESGVIMLQICSASRASPLHVETK
jgi:hypothetical protein